MIDDRYWMMLAVKEAKAALDKDEVPVGAVIVDSNNNFLASAHNKTILNCDPTAHAEVEAIRLASLALKNHRLINTTLYVTLEPCIMCMGAIIQARIKRLVFSSRDLRSGAASSVYSLHNSPHQNHNCVIDEGIMQAETSSLLKKFFLNKRK